MTDARTQKYTNDQPRPFQRPGRSLKADWREEFFPTRAAAITAIPANLAFKFSNNSYSNSCLAITRGWAAIPVGGQLLPVMLPALRRFEALRTRCDGVRPACRWRRLVRDRRRCGAPVHARRAARPATEADARRQPRAAGFLRCWCSWPLSRARSSPGRSVRTSSAGFVTSSVLK